MYTYTHLVHKLGRYPAEGLRVRRVYSTSVCRRELWKTSAVKRFAPAQYNQT